MKSEILEYYSAQLPLLNRILFSSTSPPYVLGRSSNLGPCFNLTLYQLLPTLKSMPTPLAPAPYPLLKMGG